MMKINRLLLVTLLTFYFGTSFSQTADSLSVFPNPFASSTTIHFDIIQSDTITLQVFNTTGQTIKTFFQSTILPSGSYNINFVGDTLNNGVYLVRLDIGSTKSLTKKAIKNGSTASVADNKTIAEFVIYPNPTTDQITIPFVGNKTIIITDLNGKIIKSFTTDQQVISLLNMATGHYFITILTNENEIITSQKILKNE